MKRILIFLMTLGFLSCNKDVLPNRILDGTYEVAYKVWIEPDGTEKIYMPIGSDITGMKIHGWMAQTKLIFSESSLGISQLSDNGWNTGYVELEWMNNKPLRVGCHYVHSVDQNQISWYQDDVIIKWVLIEEK